MVVLGSRSDDGDDNDDDDDDGDNQDSHPVQREIPSASSVRMAAPTRRLVDAILVGVVLRVVVVLKVVALVEVAQKEEDRARCDWDRALFANVENISVCVCVCVCVCAGCMLCGYVLYIYIYLCV